MTQVRIHSMGMAIILFLAFSFTSCSHTYPEDQLVRDLRDLCYTEYGIESVDVKISGKTIGVHLPLQQLFSTDFAGLLKNGTDVQNVQNLESILQFSPDAMEKVENVLFSTSRVILSTDKEIDFYVLTATDTETTGIQLVLAGYVDDLKRVRFWDISRDEYRKRIANDLRINRGVIWKKPVEQLFEGMETLPTDEILASYFLDGRSTEDISPLFYSELLELAFKKDIHNEIIEIKSTSLREGEVVVYTKVRSTFRPILDYVDYEFLIPSGYEAEYIFILLYDGTEFKVERVIPFHFLDETEEMERVEFPKELGLYRNIDTWLEDFSVEEIRLPDFLAQQVTRRVQQLILDDERILNTFDNVQIEFAHVDENASSRDRTERNKAAVGRYVPSHFRLLTMLTPKMSASDTVESGKELFNRENVQYLLDKALREFVQVMRSYRFEDYAYLDVISPNDHEILVLGKNQLKLYRDKKIPLVDLINASYTL